MGVYAAVAYYHNDCELLRLNTEWLFHFRNSTRTHFQTSTCQLSKWMNTSIHSFNFQFKLDLYQFRRAKWNRQKINTTHIVRQSKIIYSKNNRRSRAKFTIIESNKSHIMSRSLHTEENGFDFHNFGGVSSLMDFTGKTFQAIFFKIVFEKSYFIMNPHFIPLSRKEKYLKKTSVVIFTTLVLFRNFSLHNCVIQTSFSVYFYTVSFHLSFFFIWFIVLIFDLHINWQWFYLCLNHR